MGSRNMGKKIEFGEEIKHHIKYTPPEKTVMET